MADEWTNALTPTDDGVRVEVEVVPNAASPGFPVGYNPWRNRLQARVAATPDQGQANEELRTLVASFFGVPAADVQLVQGATSRQKQLLVQRLPYEEARRRVQEAWR